MKKLLLRLGTILLYMTILLRFFQFKLIVLFDFKTVLLVVFGTALLTAAGYKKGMPRYAIKSIARWNATVIAYLTAFILLFFRLSTNPHYENLLYDIALCCRPLLYGLILHILLKDSEKEEGTPEQKSSKYSQIPEEDTEKVRQKLKQYGVTEREMEIAFFISDGLSNSEIGNRLYISENTVKKHISNLYRKTGVSSRAQMRLFMF